MTHLPRLALVAAALTLGACGRAPAPAAAGEATLPTAQLPIAQSPSAQSPSVQAPVGETSMPSAPASISQASLSALARTLPEEMRHGPDPTTLSITKNGPYTVKTSTVSLMSARGFGGGTLYYPGNPEAGERFAGVVTIPGYMEPGSTMTLYGTRLASHGFVVLVASTRSTSDTPAQRAQAAVAAVGFLKNSAAVSSVLDSSRIALIGHSMGGGGVLEAAETLDLSAVIAVHPWRTAGKTFGGVTEPTHVIGGALDFVAPLSQYALPIYASLTGAPIKSMHTHYTGTHWAGVSDDPALQGRNLAFLKTFVDGDTRYVPFYCAPSERQTRFMSKGFCDSLPAQ